MNTLHVTDKHTLLGQRVRVTNDTTVVYTTQLNEETKPFPGCHPLHGSEIVPASGLINTFFHATGAKTLSNIVLRVPVAISAPRDVQVVVQRNQAKICSRLTQNDKSEAEGVQWITHTTCFWGSKDCCSQPERATYDVDAIKAHIGTRPANNFSIDYLDKVGVSGMGFPWAVDEHYGNLEEMIAHVDVAPEVASGVQLSWDENSWAPLLDSAISVSSTIFFDQPRLLMPAQIE